MMLLKDLCHRGHDGGGAVPRQRMSRLAAKRLPVTPERLDEIAGNPAIKSRAIPAMFGYGVAAFFKYVGGEPELWRVYAAARNRAGFVVSNFGPTEKKRKSLPDEEQIIIDGIRANNRRPNELRAFAIAAGVDARRYDTVVYILENEKHEIESYAEGLPPVTRFFTRDEREAEKEAA